MAIKLAELTKISALMIFLAIGVSNSLHALAGGGIFNCGGYPRVGSYGINDPLITGCEMLFEWREIEPEEGKYDFALIDREMQPWLKAGKMVALRIMTACNEKNAAPMWIFEKAGVPKVDSKEYSQSDIVFPVFWNKTFIDKYEAMVRAVAKRYDGHPGIEFVQVGGVGRWEETYIHTENERMSKAWQDHGYSHRTYIVHVKRMVDLFKRHFKKTPILLSISIGGPDRSGDSRMVVGYALAEYAVSRGLYLKQNGWGACYSYTDHEHFSRIFRRYKGKTKRIFEQGYDITSSWSPEPGPFRSAINRALIDCVDYLWIYQTDMSRPEFQKDLKFARDHLGQKSYRESGPLYIEFKEEKKHYDNPPSDKIHQDEGYGIYNRHPWNAWFDGGKLEPVTIEGKACKKTNKENPYVYLDVEDSVIFDECDTTNCASKLTIAVEYLDKGNGVVTVDYNWDGKEFRARSSFRKENTGRWVKKQIVLTCVMFPECKLYYPEKDLRISSEGEDLYISKVSLEF